MTKAKSGVVKPTPTDLKEDTGSGLDVLRRLSYTYDDVRTRFPLVSMVRTVECAGNRRVLFGAELGRAFESLRSR